MSLNTVKHDDLLNEWDILRRYTFLEKKLLLKEEAKVEDNISSHASYILQESEKKEYKLPTNSSYKGCLQSAPICASKSSFSIDAIEDYKIELRSYIPEIIVDFDLCEYLWKNESWPTILTDVERYKFFVKKYKGETVRDIINQLGGDKMNLKYYGLTNKSYKILLEVLKKNQTIKYLDLTNNQFKSVEIAEIFAELIKQNQTIEEINLSYCFLGSELISILCKYLKENISIKVLNLSHCNIQDGGCKRFVEELQHNQGIEQLDLSYNNLTNDCCENLGECIFLNDFMHELNLSGNEFHKLGLWKIVNSLSDSFYQNITHINMTACNIGQGCEQCLQLLASEVPGLTHLNLSRNVLNGSLIESLSNGLLENEGCLLVLNLGYNPLKSHDIKILLNTFNKLVKKNHPLKELDLTDKYIPNIYQEMIQRLTNLGKIIIFNGYNFIKYVLHDPNMKLIYIMRMNALLQPKHKKRKSKLLVDKFFTKMNQNYLNQTQFKKLLIPNYFNMSKDFIKGLATTFTIQSDIVDVGSIRDLYFQMFPKAEITSS